MVAKDGQANGHLARRAQLREPEPLALLFRVVRVFRGGSPVLLSCGAIVRTLEISLSSLRIPVFRFPASRSFCCRVFLPASPSDRQPT